MESHLKLLVGNSSTTLSDKLRGEVYEEFKQWLGYEPEDAMWRQQNNPHFKGYITTVCYDEGWCKCAVKKKGMHFPTGLVSRAAEFLQSHGIHYEIVDQRPIWTPNEVDLRLTDTLLDDNGVPYKFNLYDYQQDAVEKAVQRQRGIIKIATGGGKTKTAAGIIVALGVKPTIFYVTSMDLLMQAARDIEEVVRLNGSPVKVGKIGGGHKTIGDITVMTVQTAIRAVGEKYVKNKDDDEPDEDDKTDITDIKKELFDLIREAKLIICDECVTGSSVVVTKDGPTRMDELSGKIGKEVQSFDGNSVVWKKMTHFYKKGKRKTVRVSLSDGRSLQCTLEHPLKTSKGWLPAAAIQAGDQILCSANAVAVNEYLSQGGARAGIQNTFSDTKCETDQRKTGVVFSMTSPNGHLYASAAVEKESNFITEQCNRLSPTGAANNTTASPKGTTKDQTIGISNSRMKRNRLSWGLSSETHPSPSPQREAKPLGFIAITAYANQNGQNTKQHTSFVSQRDTGNTKTVDTEIDRRQSEHLVTKNSCASILLPISGDEKESQNNGLRDWGQSEWHGGFAMTEVVLANPSNYTQRVFPNPRFTLRPTGCPNSTVKQPFINTGDIKHYISEKTPESLSSHLLKNTYQNVCDTNYVMVESVERCGEEEVYDITVEDTHCFFANGLLAHNCQHWRAETCQIICDNSLSCRWRYGLSATPWRDAGDDILIDACFGKPIVDISASWLISNGYLVKPYITFVPIKNLQGEKFGPYAATYKAGIVDNPYRTEWISRLGQSLVEQGRTVLVLVQQIVHGETIQEAIPDSVFLHGKSGKKNRASHIKAMQSGKAPITIASTIFDEGIDVRPLDALILAGGGKSPTRALQRIGRVIRKFNYPDGRKKKDAFVYDLHDHLKYLSSHAAARKRIYRSEPEFDIREFKL